MLVTRSAPTRIKSAGCRWHAARSAVEEGSPYPPPVAASYLKHLRNEGQYYLPGVSPVACIQARSYLRITDPPGARSFALCAAFLSWHIFTIVCRAHVDTFVWTMCRLFFPLDTLLSNVSRTHSLCVCRFAETPPGMGTPPHNFSIKGRVSACWWVYVSLLPTSF